MRTLSLTAILLLVAIQAAVAGQSGKSESSAVSATITDFDGVAVQISGLQFRYTVKGTKEAVIHPNQPLVLREGGTFSTAGGGKSPKRDLPTLYIEISARQSTGYWQDTLAFELADLKRLTFEPQTNISQKDRPQLEIEKRDGSVYVFAGNRFEERSASGQKVKEFPISGWEYGGKTAGGDEVRLTYIEDGWVGQIQTPLGRPSEFLMPGGFHEIAFHSNSNPSQRQDDRFDIKVIGLRKAKEWAMFPGNSGGPTLKPKAGEVLVVVQFDVWDVRTGKKDTQQDFQDFELEDAQGHKYKSLVMKTDLREVPFSVADPGSLKLFRIAGRTLSVEKFAKALGPVAASGTAD
jgi:hypothetical protein